MTFEEETWLLVKNFMNQTHYCLEHIHCLRRKNISTRYTVWYFSVSTFHHEFTTVLVCENCPSRPEIPYGTVYDRSPPISRARDVGCPSTAKDAGWLLHCELWAAGLCNAMLIGKSSVNRNYYYGLHMTHAGRTLPNKSLMLTHSRKDCFT